MNSFAVFLRGVNVGGHGAVSMTELKQLLTAIDYKNVSSYINSGNLIVSTNHSRESAQQEISILIREKFGIVVAVFLKNFPELKDIIDNNPFDASVATNDSWKVVILLSRPVDQVEIKQITGNGKFEEIFHCRGDVLYIYFPKGYGNSKFSVNLIERKLKLKATGRNWKTMLKMKALFETNIAVYSPQSK